MLNTKALNEYISLPRHVIISKVENLDFLYEVTQSLMGSTFHQNPSSDFFLRKIEAVVFL